MALLSTIISFLMVLFSCFLFFRLKKSRMKLMVMFWSVYFMYFGYSYFTTGMSENIVAVATFVWILRVIVIKNILEDLTKKNLGKLWHNFVLLGSLLIALILMNADSSLTVISTPMAIGCFIVGINITWQSFQGQRGLKHGELHYMLLSVFVIIFFHMLTYPVIRLHPQLGVYGYSLVLLTTFIVAVLISTILFAEQEKENVLNRLAAAEGRIVYTTNLARFLLTVRDRTNTPLQTLKILQDILKTSSSIEPSYLKAFDESLDSIIRNNQNYNRLESLIDWKSENLMSEKEVESWLIEVEKTALKDKKDL